MGMNPRSAAPAASSVELQKRLKEAMERKGIKNHQQLASKVFDAEREKPKYEELEHEIFVALRASRSIPLTPEFATLVAPHLGVSVAYLTREDVEKLQQDAPPTIAAQVAAPLAPVVNPTVAEVSPVVAEPATEPVEEAAPTKGGHRAQPAQAGFQRRLARARELNVGRMERLRALMKERGISDEEGLTLRLKTLISRAREYQNAQVQERLNGEVLLSETFLRDVADVLEADAEALIGEPSMIDTMGHKKPDESPANERKAVPKEEAPAGKTRRRRNAESPALPTLPTVPATLMAPGQLPTYNVELPGGIVVTLTLSFMKREGGARILLVNGEQQITADQVLELHGM